jgi:hypothetical protein
MRLAFAYKSSSASLRAILIARPRDYLQSQVVRPPRGAAVETFDVRRRHFMRPWRRRC